LEGTVRLLVTVAPDGTVKSLQIRGGHPLLAHAAEAAVYKWRWITAKEGSEENVEVKFHPQY
jgi:TonB family protein